MDINPDKDPVIYGLIARRKEIAGQIDHLQACITRHQSDLASIDDVLRLYGVQVAEDIIKPTRAPTAGIFHRKELPRRLTETIRDHPGLTARGLALRISADKGWDVNEERFQVALGDKIVRTLTKMRSAGRVDSRNGADGVCWFPPK